jgi:hypothetical protein
MNQTVYKVGFWSGIIAFGSTVAFVIVQLLQLVRVFIFPLDEVLIYGFSLGIVVPFILEMLALHYTVSDEKKFWSHAALIFTIIYAVFVVANYVVQLATVIPFTLHGAGNEVAILRQTPHSLFWDYDAIGYISMGFATLFALPIFEIKGFQKWVRYAFFAHTLVTPLIAFVYFYQGFSEKLLLIGLPWAITAPLFMLMLAIMFKKESEMKTK